MGTYTTANLYEAAAAITTGVKPIESRFEMGIRLLVVFNAEDVHPILNSFRDGKLQLMAQQYSKMIGYLFRCKKRRELVNVSDL